MLFQLFILILRKKYIKRRHRPTTDKQCIEPHSQYFESLSVMENGQMWREFTEQLNVIRVCLTEWLVPLNFTPFIFSPGPDVCRAKHKMFSASSFKGGLTSFSIYRILTWTKLPWFCIVSWNNDCLCCVLLQGLFVSQCIVFKHPCIVILLGPGDLCGCVMQVFGDVGVGFWIGGCCMADL